jgi:hypothetical protein
VSNHEIDDAADARHDTPYVPRNAVQDEGLGLLSDGEEAAGLTRREPTLIDPALHGVARRPAAYVPQEMLTRQGLHWAIGDGGIRFDLAAFPHEVNRRHLGNVELRTIHAHLMEAVALARAEMRERGMVVDF